MCGSFLFSFLISFFIPMSNPIDFFAIAMATPCIQTYLAKNKTLSDELRIKIIKETKWWIQASFRKAVLDRSADWMVPLEKKYAEIGWDVRVRDVFHTLKMPVVLSYAVYESVSWLDQCLYKILWPFPQELEKSYEERMELERKAGLPLSPQ